MPLGPISGTWQQVTSRQSVLLMELCVLTVIQSIGSGCQWGTRMKSLGKAWTTANHKVGNGQPGKHSRIGQFSSPFSKVITYVLLCLSRFLCCIECIYGSLFVCLSMRGRVWLYSGWSTIRIWSLCAFSCRPSPLAFSLLNKSSRIKSRFLFFPSPIDWSSSCCWVTSRFECSSFFRR